MVKPAATTLQWCQKEAGPICQGLALMFRSQLGYEGRQIESQLSKHCLKTLLMSSGEIDPLNKPPRGQIPNPLSVLPRIPLSLLSESSNDAFERAGTIATGIKTFASLLAQGKYPGSGGYTLTSSGERVYGGSAGSLASEVSMNMIKGLERFADLLGTGKIPFPPAAPPNLLEKMVKLSGGTSQRQIQYQASEVSVSKDQSTDTGLTPEEEAFLLKAAQSVDDFEAEKTLRAHKNKMYKPKMPSDYQFENKEIETTMISDNSKERAVPSTRIGRLASFTQLGVGLAAGAAAELTRRAFSFGNVEEGTAERVIGSENPFLTQANADRIVRTLCRVRGAALKLGQMLSIQDSDTIPPALLEVFERVRHSADFMPTKQVYRQMIASFGENWRDVFDTFDERPFAAASIGQVHKATLKDGRVVAVKVQYPGVAQGIDSDIDNLISVLSIGNLFPKGLYLENFTTVARRELKQECDYLREARAMRKFRDLTMDSKDFYVPEVIDELSSAEVLTTEYVFGRPVDTCVHDSQVVRDYIAGKFIELCLKEIFEWRFMQTDPNWSNFFLGKHPQTGEPRLVLLDFGASRAYPKRFVDKYMNIIRGAYDGDHQKILKYSRDIGFLTGYETKVMEKAHCESILILGETLTSDTPYDFSRQNVTKRIHELIPIMLEHRLTSPPEEIYSLHRKLSGSYLLAAKLKATVSCGGLFQEIYENYRFGEDEKDIDIETAPETNRVNA